MSGEPVDFVTAMSTKGPLATKRITNTPAGPIIEPYGRAEFFRIHECGVWNIDDIARLLHQLEPCSKAFIIRGHPIDRTDYRHARRRVRDKRKSDGTIESATIEPAARYWIALDCDRMACPDWLDPLFEPDQVVEHVVSRLPEEFHDATCCWQFTSSHGIKPGISLRLFFWSDRPLADWELKLWLSDSPVDHSIFAPAQPIYVAKPIFVGMPDPVPYRSGVWRGDRDAITAPLIEKARAKTVTVNAEADSGDGSSGYQYHRDRIGDHAQGAGFFGPVKSAVAAWIGQHGSAANTGWLRADLESAIRAAPRDATKHDDNYIEIRVADLDPLIAAIGELQLANEAENAICEPTYPAPLGSVEEARAAIAAEMDRFVAEVLARHAELRRLVT